MNYETLRTATGGWLAASKSQGIRRESYLFRTRSPLGNVMSGLSLAKTRFRLMAGRTRSIKVPKWRGLLLHRVSSCVLGAASSTAMAARTRVSPLLNSQPATPNQRNHSCSLYTMVLPNEHPTKSRAVLSSPMENRGANVTRGTETKTEDLPTTPSHIFPFLFSGEHSFPFSYCLAAFSTNLSCIVRMHKRTVCCCRTV